MEKDNKGRNTPILPEYISWISEHRSNEHVSLASFAKKFSLFDKQSTEGCYEQLIKSTSIPRTRRDRLMASFVLFKKNSSLLFWESRRRIVTVEKAATLSMEAGYLRSKRAYKAMLSDTVGSQEQEQEVTDNHNGNKDKEKSAMLNQDNDSKYYFCFWSLGCLIEKFLTSTPRLLNRRAIGGC